MEKSWVLTIKQADIRKSISATIPKRQSILSIVSRTTDLMVLGQMESKHGSVAIAVHPIL
tara:strand:- start:2326 stop:2505 length:180 start_codon:yes stop_codon:yes gene_type:complete